VAWRPAKSRRSAWLGRQRFVGLANTTANVENTTLKAGAGKAILKGLYDKMTPELRERMAEARNRMEEEGMVGLQQVIELQKRNIEETQALGRQAAEASAAAAALAAIIE
jgi:hypothetical protein